MNSGDNNFSCNLPTVAIVELWIAAANGDRQAAEQIELYCDRLARALSVVINIIDPHAVVLRGGLSKMKRLYTRGPELWKQYVFSEPEMLATKLLPPRFSDSSGVHGAAWLWEASLDRAHPARS